MTYKIHKLVEPTHLSVQEDEGYSTRTVYRRVLEELNGHFQWNNEFGSIEQAYTFIKENSEHFKCMELTVIPVIDVNWDGEVR